MFNFWFHKTLIKSSSQVKWDSHKQNLVNIFHPCLDTTSIQHSLGSHMMPTQNPMDANASIEVLETSCKDGIFCIEHCPPSSHVQCFAMHKTTLQACN
jgi:hypothetical protein